MKTRRLGDSPLVVTDICLGTMTFGEQNTQADAHRQLDWALERGINFVDTAEMYPVPPRAETQGRTETLLGTWLARNRARRGEFVLASKIAGPGRRDWIRNGDTQISAKTIPWAIDDSLKRLQTDYLDLYQIHWPERYVPLFGSWQYDATKDRPSTPLLEQIEALAAAIKAGKIRAYGLSNETCFGLCEFTRLAREHGLPAPASIQNGYNLVSRMFDGDLAEASHRLNVPLLAYSPLAMGLLSGKYRGGAQPAAARLAKFPDFGVRYKRPRAIAAAEAYCALAARHGLDPAVLALAFVRSRPFVASTILGATSIAQLEALAAGFGCVLPPEVLADVAAVHVAYPSPAGQ
ncbi:MAG: aldo/keto reductase [Gammaproteobacteria bacterium]|nr:aldo/keto reductase [Gammaproteobacteria bacterium]